MVISDYDVSKNKEELIKKSLRTYKTAINTYAKENASLHFELREKNDELKHLQDELAFEKMRADAIENATFWKITKPIRQLIDIVRNVPRLQYRPISSDTKENCIKTFSDLCNNIHQISKNAEIYSENKLITYDNIKDKSVLIFAHELSLTGAPVAMLYFAQELERQGYFPVIISPRKGSLLKQCTIPVIVVDDLLDNCKFDIISKLFNIVIVGTIVGAPLINSLMNTGIPTIWWIHEAETSYNVKEWIDKMPKQLNDNIHVYVVGQYAQKMLKKYRPLYYSQNLLYYIPEISTEESTRYILPDNAKDKTVFALIGLQEYRKGQDILAEAINRLPIEYLKASYFIFIGKECYKPIKDVIDTLVVNYPQNILYIEELDKQTLASLYQDIDCMICASRDDPMPIVVTEALQCGKMVICSENTGTASILKAEKFGLIYSENSSVYLKDQIVQYLTDRKKYDNKVAARNIYNKFFSRETFAEQASEIIKQVFYPSKRPLQFATNSIKNILIISHELSLTGAPIALQNLAKSLIKCGYNVNLLSPFDGPLKKELIADEINVSVVTPENLYGEDSCLNAIAYNYDLIILNTVVTYRAVNILANSGIPVFWWIHDSFDSYSMGGFAGIMPEKLPSNVKVFCAGEYAKRALLSYYPKYATQTELLYYYLPDMHIDYNNNDKFLLPNLQKDKIVFAVIAQQDERKGQDVLVDAIALLPENIRSKAIFYFIGKPYDKPIYDSIQKAVSIFPNTIYCIDEIPHDQIFSVYEQCDCIICPSKDDPLPVFVAEAMMMSKIIICSENTGTAPIIEKNKCGIVYKKNSPSDLAQAIEQVVSHKDSLNYMKENARKTYINCFSETHFQTYFSNMMESIEGETCCSKIYVDKKISVVIPTYNPGKSLVKLVNRILKQKLVKEIELIMVDSGSSDDSVKIANDLGVTVIEIPHEEFSHSYARNLGALQAKGDIIVFMTQDALPSSHTWLNELCAPLISGEAVATSCTEINPDGTEMFYRVLSYGYAEFRKIDNGKKTINYKEAGDDRLELRKKASLTDVSTAILSEIFKDYYYRHDYAEDLDLGIRLLNDGYKIALLGNVGTVHGHNRPASYYLKRNYVEALSFVTIIDEPYCPEEDWLIASKSLSVCAAVFGAFYKINKNNVKNCILGEYIRKFKEYMFDIKKSQFIMLENWDFSFADEELIRYIDLYKKMCQSIDGDYSLINNILYYLDYALVPYLKKEGVVLVDHTWKNTINICITKYLAGVLGTELANIKENSLFYDTVSNMTTGV